jgi:CBS-domain-containing membrane protein
MKNYFNKMRGAGASCFVVIFGSTRPSMAFALASAVALMHVTRTVHAPAGSNPVTVMLTLPDWRSHLTPILLVASIIVVVALVFNNADRKVRYAKY